VRRPGVTRRRVLLGGLGIGLIGATAGAGAITDVLPGGPALRRVTGMTDPAGTVPDVPPGQVTVDRVHSSARGRDVDLIVMRPAGIASALPVCLLLHGRGGTARGYTDQGLPRFLTAAVESGVPPFAMAAVDCGDGYFLNHDGDDAMRMLIEEVPGWLADRGLPEPMAALGFSMGGWGALCLARKRRNLRAVALASPALFQRWSDARTRKVFRDERHWRAYEPLQHIDALTGTPIGLWCGTEDPFVDAAREFIAKARPEVRAISPGAHDSAYWFRVLPDIMRFVGTHLS
jgi:dienelactone hydrolase